MYNTQPYAILTLDIRPSVVLLLRIVLIQLLAAKPNKSIIMYLCSAPTSFCGDQFCCFRHVKPAGMLKWIFFKPRFLGFYKKNFKNLKSPNFSFFKVFFHLLCN